MKISITLLLSLLLHVASYSQMNFVLIDTSKSPGGKPSIQLSNDFIEEATVFENVELVTGASVFMATTFDQPIVKCFNYQVPNLLIYLDDKLIYYRAFAELMLSEERNTQFQILTTTDFFLREYEEALTILNTANLYLDKGEHTLLVGWTAGAKFAKSDMMYYGTGKLTIGESNPYLSEAEELNEGRLNLVRYPWPALKDEDAEKKILKVLETAGKEYDLKGTFSSVVIIDAPRKKHVDYEDKAGMFLRVVVKLGLADNECVYLPSLLFQDPQNGQDWTKLEFLRFENIVSCNC